ncbi:MAG: STAS/SEC14 domain-containing protein [Candidatus Competibacteraceae bacterium]|nr:STAS/SEC14 domain-containing protein [Candidatus Competibacteraceae bacterium]
MNDFEKCAVVAGPNWVNWATKLAALIMTGEVKTFSSNALNDAWAWIKS